MVTSVPNSAEGEDARVPADGAPARPLPTTDAAEPPNVLHAGLDAGSSYTTVNLAEALPGVVTPLSWSLWAPAADLSARAPWFWLGAIDEEDLAPPKDPSEAATTLVYGRAATRIDYHCHMGDLIPGTTGTDLARDAFGFIPPTFVSRPSDHRHAIVIEKSQLAFAQVPKLVGDARVETAAWWESGIGEVAGLDLDAARERFADAAKRFETNLVNAAVLIICGIQPVFTRLLALATQAGVDPGALMRGHGTHEETAMIDDLWLVSRDELTLDDYVARHGFHGPNSGEISNRSWREDRAPILPVLAGYRRSGDEADPRPAAAARTAERLRVERELVAALPEAERDAAEATLRDAERYLPMRAVTKVSFVQSIDMARAAARRIGELLHADGTLADPEDVFYLVADELHGPIPEDLASRIAERKALRAHYGSFELPVTWSGFPEVTPVAAEEAAAAAERASESLEGVGVSPGVVEGLVRVIDDPAEAEIEDDEILVAHTTDPSWASVMLLAGALVIDIGGMLSHAAVVARELGVPCVMNTRTGTRSLRTGDRVRVDGTTGVVELLQRAG